MRRVFHPPTRRLRKLVTNARDTQDKLGTGLHHYTAMREVLASKDASFNLPVTIPGNPRARTLRRSNGSLRSPNSHRGTTLTSYLSGPVATVSDLTTSLRRHGHNTSALFSPCCSSCCHLPQRGHMLVPLLLIGACIGTSQGVVSALAEIALAVNMQTIV